MTSPIEQELIWIRHHMPRLRRVVASLPELSGVRLACSVHLEIKMIPLFEALLARGAQLFLTTCNPNTVRLEVVNWLVKNGARAEAWHGMPPAAYTAALQRALDWQPTHLCEMGAGLTTTWHQRIPTPTGVQASLESTGSGLSRVRGMQLCYPVFNCNNLPIKEGLHNRHMVGLTTWQAFFERTRLSLHEKRVLVIGFGSVGRGVADAACAFGGLVWIAERDSARALEAAYAGWEVKSLDEALPAADVIVTATGAPGVLEAQHFSQLRDGAFLLNVGHHADEIELAALRAYPHQEVLPFIEAFQIGDRTIYLFAGGSMANLTAGKGDSLNSFDLTAAVLAAGIGHIVQAGATTQPGVHLLPRAVWESCLA
jgi:adenosylhomocysteinase